MGIRPLSDKKKKLLRETYGSGKEIYKKLYNIEEKHFQRIKGVTEQDIQAIRQAARNQRVDEQYEAAVDKGIRFVAYFMEDYPKRLLDYPGMPYAL